MDVISIIVIYQTMRTNCIITITTKQLQSLWTLTINSKRKLSEIRIIPRTWWVNDTLH